MLRGDIYETAYSGPEHSLDFRRPLPPAAALEMPECGNLIVWSSWI